jgi:peptidoglycan/LPS O-acetylase OafA/YrhL
MLLLGTLMSLARHLKSPQNLFEAVATLEQVATNVLLLNGLSIRGLESINVPSWSISCEMMIYALFCVVSLFAISKGVWIFGAVLGATLIALFSPLYMDATNALGIARCLYGFSLGVLAHAMLPILATKLRIATTGEIAVTGLALLFVVSTYQSPLSIAAPLVFMGVVVIFAFEAGRISAFLQSRWALLLGKLSFTIYMCHYVVMSVLYQAAFTLRLVNERRESPFFGGRVPAIEIGGDAGGAVLALVYLLAVIGVAYLVTIYIEEPSKLRSYAFARRLRLKVVEASK